MTEEKEAFVAIPSLSLHEISSISAVSGYGDTIQTAVEGLTLLLWKRHLADKQ